MTRKQDLEKSVNVKALAKFRSLLSHPWFQEIPKEAQILDLCGGMGIGGVALVKALQEKGYSPRLTLVDIREDAIKEAEKFSMEEGVTCRCIAGDALEAHSLGRFDIVLLFGAPLPHFDAWMFPRLLASASEATKDNGILVIEEMDRVDFIFKKVSKTSWLRQRKKIGSLSRCIEDMIILETRIGGWVWTLFQAKV